MFRKGSTCEVGVPCYCFIRMRGKTFAFLVNFAVFIIEETECNFINTNKEGLFTRHSASSAAFLHVQLFETV